MKNDSRITQEVDIDFYNDELQVIDFIEYDIYYLNNNNEYVLNNGVITITNLNPGDRIPFLIRLKNHYYDGGNINIYLENLEVYNYRYFDIEYLDDHYVSNDSIFNYLSFGYCKHNNNYSIESGFSDFVSNLTYLTIFEGDVFGTVLGASNVPIEYTDKTSEDIYIYSFIEISDNLPSSYKGLLFLINNIKITRS